MAFAGRAWKEEAVRLLCAEAAAGKAPEGEAVGVHDSTSLALSTALRMLPTERPRADLGSAELAEFLEGKRAEAERGEEAGFLVSELHSATGDDMERAAVVSRTKICVPCCSDGLRFVSCGQAAELLDSGCAELAEVQTAFLAEACEGSEVAAAEGGKGEL